MRFHEIVDIVEMSQDKTYNWTSPIKLYRGSWRGRSDAFSDTTRGYPTFTDVFEIAEGYARIRNDGGAVSTNGKVFAYTVAPKKPLLMWGEGGPESVTEIGFLKQALHLSDQDALSFLYNSEIQFRSDGEEIDFRDFDEGHIQRVLNAKYDDPFLYQNNIYTDSYHLADNAYIQEQAKANGYDCLILRGPYSHDIDPVDLSSDHSYDVDGALEWKVLEPSIVTLIGEVSRNDLMKTPQTPVEEFLQKWVRISDSNGPGAQRMLNGVVVSLSPFTLDRAQTIYIESINAYYRGMGKGNAALQTIIKLADNTGVKLVLTPKALDTRGRGNPLTDEQLVAWYERNGFVRNSNGSMTRKPKQPLKLGNRMRTIPVKV